MIQNNPQKNSRPRAIILSPTTSQPRYHRRAAMLMAAGYDVKVYAFQRGFYEENTYPPEVEVFSLGHVQDLKYFSRLPKLVRAVFRVRRCERKEKSANLIYAFGLDMALIGWMAMPASMPLVYEVGDVATPLPHVSFISKLIEKIERCILHRCSALTVTSCGFVKDYFNIIAPGINKKAIVVENMISKEVALDFPRPKTHRIPVKPIKIGFVGLYRYKDSLVALMEAVAKRKGDFELHFYGDGHIKSVIDRYAAKYDNIVNHGSFKSVADMKKIYEAIDVSYAVYDNRRPNVRMALPNKLYEAPYFGVPIAVADKTYLSERVREFGCGFIIDPQAEGFVDCWLDEMTPERIGEMSRKMLELNEKHMVENYDDIVPKLREIGSSNEL